MEELISSVKLMKQAIYSYFFPGIKFYKQSEEISSKDKTKIMQAKINHWSLSGEKSRNNFFYVMLASMRKYMERRGTKTARTNHTEVYRSVEHHYGKQKIHAACFSWDTNLKPMKICVSLQLKINSAPLRSAQCQAL